MRAARYPWRPAEPTVALFAQNALRLTGQSGDRAILTQYFGSVGHPASQPGQATAPAPEGLSDSGRLVYALLTTTDPSAVDALLTQLSPAQLAEITALSPSVGIERLQARLFIMHDTSDPYVPVTESYRLDAAVRDPNEKYYAHFAFFQHVRPAPAALDRITLLRESASGCARGTCTGRLWGMKGVCEVGVSTGSHGMS